MNASLPTQSYTLTSSSRQAGTGRYDLFQGSLVPIQLLDVGPKRLSQTAVTKHSGLEQFLDASLSGLPAARFAASCGSLGPTYIQADVELDDPERARVVPIHDNKRHMASRFRMLKRLPDNHDGEGAKAPIPETVDAALAFIEYMEDPPRALATLDDEGHAVLEFHEGDQFVELIFNDPGRVTCYWKGAAEPSRLVDGTLNDQDVLDISDGQARLAVSRVDGCRLREMPAILCRL